MMMPDSAKTIRCHKLWHVRNVVRHTVLRDGHEALLDLPAGTADRRERLENFNRLAAVQLDPIDRQMAHKGGDRVRMTYTTVWVELGETGNGPAPGHELAEVHDVLARAFEWQDNRVGWERCP